MKFFSTSQIRELDTFTIQNEPIASIDLMERAAQCLYLEVLRRIESDRDILIFAGPGNNGGDALAVARMLLQSTFKVQVLLIYNGKLSGDAQINRERLIAKFPTALTEQTTNFEAPLITENTVIIDGLLGSGLNRTITGIFAEAIYWINKSNATVISIDIPSGLQGEENAALTAQHSQTELTPIIKADLTFSFQFPKLAFLLPESAIYVGHWELLDIKIHPIAIAKQTSNYYYIEKWDIQSVLKQRQKFSHKGTFGSALIVAGSTGMAGASVLSAAAALRSGAGLVTIHGPSCNRTIVQTVVPEAIFNSDKNEQLITHFPCTNKFNAIAIGPGIGTATETVKMLEQFLLEQKSPCILDADALNIIAENIYLLKYIPQNSILTPHPKEFERLVGKCSSAYIRMQKAQSLSQELQIIIILKGAHTIIALPNGQLLFNSTGNSGMSTAGSGDVLTGILAGLLAQGYTPEDTAKIAVFIHGLAADLALEHQSEESLIASDIVGKMGKAFQSISQLSVTL